MARRTTKSAKMSKSANQKLNEQDVQSMIQKKAYELWEKKGGSVGHELDNWLEAERIVRGKNR